MNHRPVGRDIGAYLLLVMGGSTVVALVLPHSVTAPALATIVPVAVLLTVLLVVRVHAWRSPTRARRTDPRTEPAPALDLSGVPR